MEYFARKTHACALSRGSYTYMLYLLELTGNPTIAPTEFVLYRKVLSSVKTGEEITHIICFRARTAKDAFRRFFSPGAGVRKDFPGFEDAQWRSDVQWLHESVENKQDGKWIAVERPLSASQSVPRRSKEDIRRRVVSSWETR